MGRRIRNQNESKHLADLTGDEVREHSAKDMLAGKLNRLLDERELSQHQAARLLGMSQPKISAIRNHKLQGISLERLMQALTALGQEVEIVVSPSRRRVSPRIQVAA